MRRKLHTHIIIYILKDISKNFKECYFKKKRASENKEQERTFRKLNRTVCHESPRPLSGSVVCWMDSQGSTCSHNHSYDLIQQKDTKQNQRKEKVQVPEEARHKCPRVFSPQKCGVRPDMLSSSSNELQQHM